MHVRFIVNAQIHHGLTKIRDLVSGVQSPGIIYMLSAYADLPTKLIWGFHKWGYPPISHFSGIFHELNHLFWVPPWRAGTPPILLAAYHWRIPRITLPGARLCDLPSLCGRKCRSLTSGVAVAFTTGLQTRVSEIGCKTALYTPSFSPRI